MVNKFALFLILILSSGFINAWEIEDLNGTYVDEEGFLKGNYITGFYSWGRGLTIPNTTLEIDLGEGKMKIPWLGLIIINDVKKDEHDVFHLEVFDIVDIDRIDPLQITITFIDSKRAYIVCDKWQRWRATSFSPEAQWVWYRLSWPRKAPSQ